MATIAQTDDFAPVVPAFIIKELTGRQRELRLTGRALPYAPLDLSGSLKAEITRYPGNPIATATVTGTEEDDTTVNGEWKDKFLRGTAFVSSAETSTRPGPAQANGSTIETVERLVELVDNIRRSGQLLQVSWGRITRRGLLTSFKQSWKNTNDCAWTCTFQWVSQGDPPAPSPVVERPRPGDGHRAIRGTSNLLDASINDRPSTPTYREWFANVNRAVAQGQAAVNQYGNAISGYVGDAQAPLDLARNCMSLCGSIVGSAQEVIDLFDFVAPEELFFGNFRDGKIVDNFALQVEQLAYRTEAVFNARVMKRQAAIERRNLGATLESDLLAIYYAKRGETLREVSTTYYGSPNNWRELLLYNDLKTPELSAGQLVLVPRMDTGTV
jgi:hypothetical protein